MSLFRRGFVVLVAVLLAPQLPAQDGDGSKVYKKAIRSVVWVHSTRDRGLATGSGTLIDKDRRIVLTNYHVVEDNPRAKVFFPEFREDKPIAEKKYYTERAGRFAIPGRVIAVEKAVDLALIQLERLPDGATAVPVAARSAEPGQSVHSIGNTGKSDALWGYVPGKVRQVYKKEWRARLDRDRILKFKAEVVETDSPTNPGDSGGPLLNNAGELVGVTQGGALDAQSVSTFVDVTEVHKLLKAEGVKDEPVAAAKKADLPATKREKPTTVADGAKLLTAETVKKLQDAVNELHDKQKIDLLFETYAAVPKDDLEKVKAMKPEEQTKYMREWAAKRQKAEGVTGVIVLVSSDPRKLFVTLTEDAVPRFPEGFYQKVIKALTDGLKAQKANDAALEVAKLVAENVKKK